MEHQVNTSTLRLGDDEDHKKRWGKLISDAGCAFDYISSSTLLEWMCQQNAVPNDIEEGGYYNRYRQFSRLCKWETVVPQLILFEDAFLSVGTYYRDHVDLEALNKLGFVKEFPRPHESRYLDMYELLRPAVKNYLGWVLSQIADKTFEEIWTERGQDARLELQNYDGLAEWLFKEFSKDACGMQSGEGELIERLEPGLAFHFFDFIEYASHGQGHFLDAPVPHFSSILKPTQSSYYTVPEDRQGIREDVFALYQISTSSTLGFQPIVNTFSDVMRLREDPYITHVRELLSLYHNAITVNESEIVNDISKELESAKKKLKRIEFTDSPIYTYGVAGLSFVPIMGSVVSILSNAIQIYKDFNKRKNGWIYFGAR